MRTLAIDPGMRELGYAGLEENEIKLFGVHTINPRRSRTARLRDAERFTQNLIEKFDPHLFVIEDTRYAKSKRSPALHTFGDTMRQFATRRGLMVCSFTSAKVKEALTGNRRTPKEALANILVSDQYFNHPGLTKRLRTDRRTQKKYWQNAFDALALALTAHQGIERRTTREPSARPS